MTTRIKNSVSRFGLIFFIIFEATFWVVGCATHPDPLAGWKPASKNPDQAITSDYQDYIQKEKLSDGPDNFFEDGTGQHAITIIVGINGRWWRHVLIYDKDDKRIKTIKYATGYYRS